MTMPHAEVDTSEIAVGASHPDHGSLRTYLLGFGLSVVLTALAFGLAMTGVLSGELTAALIIVCALAQIAVHTLCFLHVSPRAEGGWTLLALIFTLVMVVIVIAGSLWIMYHLHGNMMPRAPVPLVDPVTAQSPVAV